MNVEPRRRRAVGQNRTTEGRKLLGGALAQYRGLGPGGLQVEVCGRELVHRGSGNQGDEHLLLGRRQGCRRLQALDLIGGDVEGDEGVPTGHFPVPGADWGLKMRRFRASGKIWSGSRADSGRIQPSGRGFLGQLPEVVIVDNLKISREISALERIFLSRHCRAAGYGTFYF